VAAVAPTARKIIMSNVDRLGREQIETTYLLKQIIVAGDPVQVRRNLRTRLTDWQGLLRRETPEGRQILREVLVGRLTFAPKIDGSARYYEFTGQATLSGLLAGVVTSDRVVTPARIARC
jgi:hypothetical protein